mmetsp:Transcript_17405/g.33031  ORF Transcript_17405/g.33031 Transcript_17405/m.33031 type:complete len:499 (+) Transcript_17405:70-1566(+)
MKLQKSISYYILTMGTLINFTRNRATAFSTMASTTTRARQSDTRVFAPSIMIRHATTIPRAEESVVTDRNVESLTDAATGNQVLGKFPFGKSISNKHEVFDKVDRALGVDKPPDIEVILTDHMTNLNNSVSKFLHLNVMRFGHIAIRYTTSDGKQQVMNIMGNFTDPDSTLINFFEPSEYFFGTDPKIAQQGGVYSRPFVGVRIENAAPGATDALHAYYQAVSKASEIGDGHQDTQATMHNVAGAPGSAKRGAARFQLVEVQFSRVARFMPAPLDKILFKAADWIREQDDRRREAMLKASQAVNDFMHEQDEKLTDGMMRRASEGMEVNMKDIRGSIYQAGNCAQWTSGGLDFSGLIRRARIFPKAILIDLLEDEYLTNRRPNNVNVVYYSEVEDAPQLYEGYKCIKSAMVHPLKPIRNDFYDDMKQFASAIVEVPPGSDEAVVRAQTPVKQPQPWLQYLSLGTTYVPAAVLVGLIDHVGPLGPTTAAAWLFANWWLY